MSKFNFKLISHYIILVFIIAQTTTLFLCFGLFWGFFILHFTAIYFLILQRYEAKTSGDLDETDNFDDS